MSQDLATFFDRAKCLHAPMFLLTHTSCSVFALYVFMLCVHECFYNVICNEINYSQAGIELIRYIETQIIYPYDIEKGAAKILYPINFNYG